MLDLKGILDPITAIINKVVPDRAAAAAATAALNAQVLQGQLEVELLQLQSVTSAQSDINKVEASSPSLFVAGPRPAIMWICAAALAYQYLGIPLVTFGFDVAGHALANKMPGLDDNLYQLLWAMLGLGAMRSFDKVKGVATTGLK